MRIASLVKTRGLLYGKVVIVEPMLLNYCEKSWFGTYVRPVLFDIGFRSNCTMQLKDAQETLPSSQILIGRPLAV